MGIENYMVLISLLILFCDCKRSSQIEIQFGCVDSDEEIPSNISNLEVKLICGEGSARGTWCQNSKMHPLFIKKALERGLFYFKGISLLNVICYHNLKCI